MFDPGVPIQLNRYKNNFKHVKVSSQLRTIPCTMLRERLWSLALSHVGNQQILRTTAVRLLIIIKRHLVATQLPLTYLIFYLVQSLEAVPV